MFDLEFTEEGFRSILALLHMDKFHRATCAGVSAALALVVFLNPSLHIRCNSRVERRVFTLDDVDIPHPVLFQPRNKNLS